MDRRIETRVIDTGGATKSILIQKDACQVWWISTSVETPGTAGMLKVYDGFDAGGKLQWQMEPSYHTHCNFVPPIPCDQGIFIYNDAKIASYTIAYSPRSRRKEQ